MWVLKGRSKDAQGRETVRRKHLRSIREKLRESKDEVECALLDAAETELGYENRKQPDWFRESEADHKPLVAERNRLYVLWLSTGHKRDKKKHGNAHRIVRWVISVAKNAWFQCKVLEAERGRQSGRLVWRCIRDIQRGRRGLVPVRSASVKDENGNVCMTFEVKSERNFTKILNIDK